MRERHVLDIRETYNYRDYWSYMDRWTNIGSYTVLTSKHRDRDTGNAERSSIFIVCVDSTAKEEDILHGLDDSFTSSHCTHEYDCCGCRSFHGEAKRINGKFYAVRQTSSCNW